MKNERSSILDKYQFCFLLKTYERDFSYAIRLIRSFNKHNKDEIKLFLIISRENRKQFETLMNGELNRNIEIIEEELCECLVKKDFSSHLSKGYINQEIIKLWFWELNLCENYCCIDSDAIFIRDFYISDFMYDIKTPYTIAIEDKELMVDNDYYNNYWIYRQKDIERIVRELDLKESKIFTCHGFQTINGDVMRLFKNNFMKEKNYSYSDLLRISPLEFSWYTLYTQRCGDFKFVACEPQFKTYHTTKMLYFDIRKGIKIESLKRGYIGVILQSNFIYNSIKQKMVIKNWIRRETNGI